MDPFLDHAHEIVVGRPHAEGRPRVARAFLSLLDDDLAAVQVRLRDGHQVLRLALRHKGRKMDETGLVEADDLGVGMLNCIVVDVVGELPSALLLVLRRGPEGRGLEVPVVDRPRRAKVAAALRVEHEPGESQEHEHVDCVVVLPPCRGVCLVVVALEGGGHLLLVIFLPFPLLRSSSCSGGRRGGSTEWDPVRTILYERGNRLL